MTALPNSHTEVEMLEAQFLEAQSSLANLQKELGLLNKPVLTKQDVKPATKRFRAKKAKPKQMGDIATQNQIPPGFVQQPQVFPVQQQRRIPQNQMPPGFVQQPQIMSAQQKRTRPRAGFPKQPVQFQPAQQESLSRRPRGLTLEVRSKHLANPPNTLREVLSKYCLQELALSNWLVKRPILVGDFQTIERALSRINAHSIRSLPVVDKNKIVIGLIDIMDITKSIAESLRTMGDVHEVTAVLSQPGKARSDFMTKSVGSLLGEKQYFVASNQMSLIDAVQYMVELDQERFMIVDRPVMGNVEKFTKPEESLDGMVTQADVVRFLAQNAALLRMEPIFQMSLRDLGIGSRTPLIVSQHEIASKAFIEMYEHRSDFAAVVDDYGRLMDTISASDLKGLNRSNCVSLSQTLDQFVNRDWKRGWWAKPITVELTDPLFFVVFQFVSSGVHRLYIVDSDGKPIGEVNHMDILKVLLRIR